MASCNPGVAAAAVAVAVVGAVAVFVQSVVFAAASGGCSQRPLRVAVALCSWSHLIGRTIIVEL